MTIKYLITTRIDSGVPIPEGHPEWIPTHSNLPAWVFTVIEKMKPGDSVVLPKKRAVAFSVAAKQMGRNPVTKRLDSGGIRIWVRE